jgi:hypothetical protein
VATRSKMSAAGSANATWQKADDALTVNKGVEDAHGAVADAGVGVHLLEDCDASEWCLNECAECANSPL